MQSILIPLLVVGPTASGKTSLSIELAQKLGYEIYSTDSRQCYKGLQIGTAAPTPEESAKVLHHNIGVLNPNEKESASAFLIRLNAQFPNWSDPNTSDKPLLFVGGSTLNAQALIFGLDQMPSANPENLKKLEHLLLSEGEQALLDRLKEVDPEYVKKMDGFNRQRTFRALDVYWQSNRPFSSYHTHNFAENPSDIIVFGLNPDRKQLYERINARVDNMWEQGLVEECHELLAQGYDEQSPALEGVGYREVLQVIRGEISKSEAIEKMKTRSRRYAKRQLTWFKRWKFIHWFDNVENARTKIPYLVEQLNNK